MAFAKYNFIDKTVEKTSGMGKPQPTNKILICIPYWAGDKRQAMKLARLLADLENEHSKLADILFVSRFDCEHDVAAVKYATRRFNTFTHTSKRRSTGWPMGCNGTFFGSMEWCYHKMSTGKAPQYKAVLNLAGDSCPLRRDWLATLSHAWDLTNARRKTYVAGPFLKDARGSHDHINGDAMMLSGDLKFLKWLAITVGDMKVPVGWDWGLANDFKNWGWENFPFIKSIWQKPGFSHEEWDWEYNQGTVLIHGVKNDDLLDISRKNLV